MDCVGESQLDDFRFKWGLGIISTKLNIPQLSPKMVERTHLLDRLSEGRSARLVVISGTAGSGKTSLACRWIERDGLRVAWYSLDEADNDPDLFFRYLVAALRTVDDEIVSTYARWLRDGRRPTRREIVCHLIERLAGLSSDVFLVLDDFHFISSGEIHDSVAYLLHHAPPRLHLVITTRYGLPFSVPHFKVRNQVVEISAFDMRFTERETEEFFEETMPLVLTADEILAVSRHIEGWVGGLQLFALSLRHREMPSDLDEALNGLDRDAGNYLLDEVVRVQPPKVREFLEMTALLDRFNVEMCREITGMEDCAAVLENVRGNNLFLIPLNAEGTWYRYHQIFSQALKERMRASFSEKATRVYRSAAVWFARNGYLEEAFRNAFASGDDEFAADLMEDHLLSVNDRYEYASGRRWLAKLPHEVFIKRTLLRLYDCGHRIEACQFSEIEAVIKDIESDQANAFQRYEGHKRVLCEDLFVYFKHIVRYFYRDPVHADIESLKRTVEMISPGNKRIAGHVKVLVGLSYILQGEPKAAENALNEALPLIVASGTAFGRVFWYRSMANVERLRGRLQRSEAILQEAFEFLRLKGLSGTPLRFLLYLPLAWIHYQRNDLEKALEYAKGAASYGERVALARDAVEGNLLLSLIYFAKGHIEELEAAIRESQRLINEYTTTETNGSVDPRIVSLWMRLGNAARTAQWSDREEPAADGTFSIHFLHERLARAESRYYQGSYREALDILEELRRSCIERGMLEAVLGIDLYRCEAYRLLGQDEKARHVLQETLLLARGEDYVRPFVDHSGAVLAILSDLIGDGPERHAPAQLRPIDGPGRHLSAYLRLILTACRLDCNRGGATRQVGRKNNFELTLREVEVLKLMAAGYRYKEIAVQMSVSLETIRTHTRHILEKLNADSRGQAIRRAKSLQLL